MTSTSIHTSVMDYIFCSTLTKVTYFYSFKQDKSLNYILSRLTFLNDLKSIVLEKQTTKTI